MLIRNIDVQFIQGGFFFLKQSDVSCVPHIHQPVSLYFLINLPSILHEC